jgi:hypothetical protein
MRDTIGSVSFTIIYLDGNVITYRQFSGGQLLGDTDSFPLGKGR